MRSEDVARVRSFNRTVTQRVGALQEQYLARDRSLGAARVLWEVGSGERDLRELRRVLGLDSGYLSRLLRGLEADGLVEVRPGEHDRRVRVARVTRA
ncbi:MAG: MarR family transcriptional regulator, partial [Nocardioidaceae bacterium]|nr:MarR family transcriptional regulator [Nocardioidaceae bacterium]